MVVVVARAVITVFADVKEVRQGLNDVQAIRLVVETEGRRPSPVCRTGAFVMASGIFG